MFAHRSCSTAGRGPSGAAALCVLSPRSVAHALIVSLGPAGVRSPSERFWLAAGADSACWPASWIGPRLDWTYWSFLTIETRAWGPPGGAPPAPDGLNGAFVRAKKANLPLWSPSPKNTVAKIKGGSPNERIRPGAPRAIRRVPAWDGPAETDEAGASPAVILAASPNRGVGRERARWDRDLDDAGHAGAGSPRRRSPFG